MIGVFVAGMVVAGILMGGGGSCQFDPESDLDCLLVPKIALLGLAYPFVYLWSKIKKKEDGTK